MRDPDVDVNVVSLIRSGVAPCGAASRREKGAIGSAQPASYRGLYPSSLSCLLPICVLLSVVRVELFDDFEHNFILFTFYCAVAFSTLSYRITILDIDGR